MRCSLGRSGVVAALTDDATMPGSIPVSSDTVKIEVAASEEIFKFCITRK
jgi:hypothetical protein